MTSSPCVRRSAVTNGRQPYCSSDMGRPSGMCKGAIRDRRTPRSRRKGKRKRSHWARGSVDKEESSARFGPPTCRARLIRPGQWSMSCKRLESNMMSSSTHACGSSSPGARPATRILGRPKPALPRRHDRRRPPHLCVLGRPLAGARGPGRDRPLCRPPVALCRALAGHRSAGARHPVARSVRRTGRAQGFSGRDFHRHGRRPDVGHAGRPRAALSCKLNCVGGAGCA